jgi:hypothetical protein
MADVGDPQIRTDHPWYPGELAVSTFERLFTTQAEQYERATGQKADTDEHRALASWFWRNTHYAHGEEGAEDLWGTGFTAGDLRGREYWTGLFAHGFGLCGTTHSQWTAEMQYLLGHTRGRGVGTAGHNSFEVWLTGGEYGTGRWALLDHDLSTVIFDPAGRRLLSIPEVKANWQTLIRRDYLPEKQRGWLVCGLHPGDGGVYKEYQTAEYLAGYAGPPPMVHLRRGETFRRYFEPGLESGKEFVFWGRNADNGGIPGLERNHTWVNQPEKMLGSTAGAGSKTGQVRFANAVFTYQPDFASSDYREGIVEESDRHVVFEFSSPYIVAATPPNAKPWGIYDPGCTGGLMLKGRANCDVAVSVDRGRTWSPAQKFRDGLDLTDAVKGHRQYLLRLSAGAKALVASDLTIRTVCQANAAILPRLKDGGTSVSFAASQQAVVSVGPNKPQAETQVIDGAFNSPSVTLKVTSPRGEPITAIHAAAQFASGNPPDGTVKYRIDCSHDNGSTWQPVVSDWSLERRGDDPPDFWSQSFCYGSARVNATTSSVLVRFSNTAKRAILRAEAHATYRTAGGDSTKVTYQWTDASGDRSATNLFRTGPTSPWVVPTGKDVRTRWVEFAAVKE